MNSPSRAFGCRRFVCTIAAAVFLATPVCADRAEIQETLAAMERAVLAADIPGYLAHVDGSDPVFFKEQENWAADLRLHVPVEFTLQIVEAGADAADAEDGAPVVEPGAAVGAGGFWDQRAEFTLKMTWRMHEDNKAAGGARRRSVMYPVAFARSDDGSWKYLGERWVRTESVDADGGKPSVIVMYTDGFDDAATKVAAVMPEVRAHVEPEFEVVNPDPQEVKIYPSMSHLQASIYLSYVDGLSGWNEPGESIKLIVSRRPTEGGLKALLGHEYGHCITFIMGPRMNDAPWWVLEGSAELASMKWSQRRGDAAAITRAAARRAAQNRLAPWAELADFRTVEDRYKGHVYWQGQAMLVYISERFGRTARNDWLKAMALGNSLDEATVRALGMPFATLDTEWRDHLAKIAETGEEAAPQEKPAE